MKRIIFLAIFLYAFLSANELRAFSIDTIVRNDAINRNKFTFSIISLIWSPARFGEASKVSLSSNAMPAYGFDIGYRFYLYNKWFAHTSLFLNRERINYRMRFNADDFSPYFNNLPTGSSKEVVYDYNFGNWQAGLGIRIGYEINLAKNNNLLLSSGILAFYSFVNERQKFFYFPGFENNLNPLEGNVSAVFQQNGSRPSGYGFPYMVPFVIGYSTTLHAVEFTLSLEYNWQLPPLNQKEYGVIFLPKTPVGFNTKAELPLNNFGIRFQAAF